MKCEVPSLPPLPQKKLSNLKYEREEDANLIQCDQIKSFFFFLAIFSLNFSFDKLSSDNEKN